VDKAEALLDAWTTAGDGGRQIVTCLNASWVPIEIKRNGGTFERVAKESELSRRVPRLRENMLPLEYGAQG